MKTFKSLALLILIVVAIPASAQTADEILANYFENTGGQEAWGNLEGIKFIGTANAQGMSIPIELIQTKDERMMLKVNVQGQEIVQMAFDGEKMWTTNFMTMLPEEADAETTSNAKKQMADFPDPFLNYKEKGYSVELMGTETMEGTETFKIKLTRKPVMVDGKEEPNVTFYYFETENFVPIATEAEVKQGPMKGQMMKDTLSDYQEVDGLYFPFAITMGGGQPVTITEIVLNPELDDAMFAMPESAETETEEKN